MKKFYINILMLAVCLMFSYTAAAKTWVVTVSDYQFNPSNLTHVTARDTIKWIWDGGTHTTTSTTIPFDALDWDYEIDINNQTAIYIPTINGTYAYICSIHSQMQGHFTVSGAQGIGETDNPGALIFPNPFRDRLEVTLIDGITIKDMKVYNATGNLVLTEEINQHGSFITYDLADLPKGIYFLSFITRDGRTFSRKVIHD